MAKKSRPPKTAKELLARYAKGERDFMRAELAGVLRSSGFRGAELSGAELSGADLSGANLCYARLGRASLSHVDLRKADLSFANLSRAKLSHADLRKANLSCADLSGAILSGVRLEGATFGATVVGDADLRESGGLVEVHHFAPSTIGSDTLARSKGQVPATFLRGCGLSEWEIQAARLYNPELSTASRQDILYTVFDLQTSHAIQVNPLFLSYSRSDGAGQGEYTSDDSGFLDALCVKLEKKGVRYWRDVHHATAGKLDKVIDRAIRMNPTVVIVLSERSLASDWVEDEVNRARELERELGRDVLCPITLGITPGAALDIARERWSSTIHTQLSKYSILDFSDWQDSAAFDRQFRKLLDGLKLFYEPSEEEGGG